MSARAWAVVAMAVLAGCVPRVPRQVLPASTPMAVAVVVDRTFSGDASAPPDPLLEQLGAELQGHNLAMQLADPRVAGHERLSDARFAALKQARAERYHLLVELSAHFFSQLDGRYRWQVGVALTADRPDGRSAKDSFEVPVMLMFEHEQAPEAIASAAHDIASRVGTLLDGLLAGESAPAAQARPNAIYFAMVDRFADADPGNDGDSNPNDPSAFHGGDLDGLTARLDWIQALGADAVWISPVFTMRTAPWHGYGAFHGYWTWDLNSIEPRFGGLPALERLSKELHRRGMKLILDLVLNHVGPDAPLLTAHPEWFHRLGGVTDWNDAEQLLTHDVHGLSDFAQERPQVYAYLLAAARRWL